MGYNLNKDMDTGYGIQPKHRIWIQDMGYSLNKDMDTGCGIQSKQGYGYRMWDTV